MSADTKSSMALVGVIGVCLSLIQAFRADLWGHPEPLIEVPLVDGVFTNTATVRTNAAELVRTDGDTSGQDCYACHDKAKPPEVKLDAQGAVVLPEEHKDLVLQHGRNKRNDHCYNCHDSANLDQLLTRDGTRFKLVDGTRLCASCHGPTYRDWEVGIHGRLSGHWDRSSGSATKQDCTACHDPHAPAFPPIKPAPAPHPLRPVTRVGPASKGTH